jgi:hypothetical protein
MPLRQQRSGGLNPLEQSTRPRSEGLGGADSSMTKTDELERHNETSPHLGGAIIAPSSRRRRIAVVVVTTAWGELPSITWPPNQASLRGPCVNLGKGRLFSMWRYIEPGSSYPQTSWSVGTKSIFSSYCEKRGSLRLIFLRRGSFNPPWVLLLTVRSLVCGQSIWKAYIRDLISKIYQSPIAKA